MTNTSVDDADELHRQKVVTRRTDLAVTLAHILKTEREAASEVNELSGGLDRFGRRGLSHVGDVEIKGERGDQIRAHLAEIRQAAIAATAILNEARAGER